MFSSLRPALSLLVLFTAVTGVAYPLLTTVLAQVLMPQQARGSLIEQKGVVIGSELIGQNFSSEKYFHGRLSAAGQGYDAAASSGSNLGPSSAVLRERIAKDTATKAAQNPGQAVPPDSVTTSASGLDPHITPENAAFQIPRVARARGITTEKLQQQIDAVTEPRWFGVLGEPTVNVLQLNLALDGTNTD